MAYNPDPKVVGWIVQAANQTGADPRALLATSLQEAGAQRGHVGDQGTSFGPFQFHQGGALGSHTPAWANSYEAVLNRAQEFKRLGVHGGPGAAAVQRPADRAGYAASVQNLLAQADQILKRYGHAPAASPKATPTPSSAPTPSTVVDDPTADEGPHILEALQNLHGFSRLPGSSALMTGDPRQDALNNLTSLARIPGMALPAGAAPTLPTAQSGGEAPTSPGRTVRPGADGRKPSTAVTKIPVGKVIPGKPKIIGTPHAGTHTLGNWESDNAVDIAMPQGTPIRAPADGVIGSQIGSLGSNNPRFAGLRVHLKMAGDELYLAHLSRLNVKAGQRVKAGQIIGYSGIANGIAHLHLGSRAGKPYRYA